MEGWRVRKGGERFWASVTINAVHDEAGHLLGFAKVTRDLTERRAIEDQLRQMQKMEAIGQLTGGIAHDFNNMLTVISGNIETLQRRLERDDPGSHRLIAAALRGVERAATLTHRLLAYSRRQPLDPKPIELNRLIIGMSDLLTRTLGETHQGRVGAVRRPLASLRRSQSGRERRSQSGAQCAGRDAARAAS